MQTEKLFYADGHKRTFSAKVLSCQSREEGFGVILDKTAFYPEGGGQPGDTGTLGAARVLDTREQGEDIVHICDSPLETGAEVWGEIDWERRFDFMQQHTGEHILSGIIHETYGYSNNGFHIGADVVTVDFDGPVPTEDILELERQANQAVWENLPVSCGYPAEEELKTIPYRTKRALPWPVRIVDVTGVDCCACCGIHVATTGEVGMIKILSMVKFHQGVRMEMVCGKRALKYFQLILEQNRQVSQAFSAKLLETGEAARKVNEQLAAEKFRAVGLEKQVFEAVAKTYRNRGNVLHFEEGLTPGSARLLAEKIGAVCDGIAAVACENGEGYTLCLISPEQEVKELGLRAINALNGRGGGKNGAFQGTVNATKEEITGFFRNCGFESQR